MNAPLTETAAVGIARSGAIEETLTDKPLHRPGDYEDAV